MKKKENKTGISLKHQILIGSVWALIIGAYLPLLYVLGQTPDYSMLEESDIEVKEVWYERGNNRGMQAIDGRKFAIRGKYDHSVIDEKLAAGIIPREQEAGFRKAIEEEFRVFETYDRGDRAVLAEIKDQLLPALLEKTIAVHESHRKVWRTYYVDKGWRILDDRYGAMKARIATAIEELDAYLSGAVDALDELAEPRYKRAVSGFQVYRRITAPVY